MANPSVTNSLHNKDVEGVTPCVNGTAEIVNLNIKSIGPNPDQSDSLSCAPRMIFF